MSEAVGFVMTEQTSLDYQLGRAAFTDGERWSASRSTEWRRGWLDAQTRNALSVRDRNEIDARMRNIAKAILAEG